jgi:hypothetical protein
MERGNFSYRAGIRSKAFALKGPDRGALSAARICPDLFTSWVYRSKAAE